MVISPTRKINGQRRCSEAVGGYWCVRRVWACSTLRISGAMVPTSNSIFRSAASCSCRPPPRTAALTLPWLAHATPGHRQRGSMCRQGCSPPSPPSRALELSVSRGSPFPVGRLPPLERQPSCSRVFTLAHSLSPSSRNLCLFSCKMSLFVYDARFSAWDQIRHWSKSLSTASADNTRTCQGSDFCYCCCRQWDTSPLIGRRSDTVAATTATTRAGPAVRGSLKRWGGGPCREGGGSSWGLGGWTTERRRRLSRPPLRR